MGTTPDFGQQSLRVRIGFVACGALGLLLSAIIGRSLVMVLRNAMQITADNHGNVEPLRQVNPIAPIDPRYLASWTSNADYAEFMRWEPNPFFDSSAGAELCKLISDNDFGGVVRYIESGGEVNCTGKNGVTPLHWAMFVSNLEAFRLLLANGADPDAELTEPVDCRDEYPLIEGDSVLISSYRCGKFDFGTAALAFSKHPTANDQYGLSLIHIYLVQGFRGGGRGPLKAMIEAGADVNGTTEFHFAQESRGGGKGPLKVMNEAGADVNGRTESIPLTIIAIAGFNWSPDLCLELLEAGADPNPSAKLGLGCDVARFVELELRDRPSRIRNPRTIALIEWLEKNHRKINTSQLPSTPN